MEDITYGSVCSGIEAATAAWRPLGMQCSWVSEVAKYPSEVLKIVLPECENLGDMTTIAERIDNNEVYAPEILVGGTPCQSFSTAGLRQGLADPRGMLVFHFSEIANAIDRARARAGKPPCITVWENVTGCTASGNAGEASPFDKFVSYHTGHTAPVTPPKRKGRKPSLGVLEGPTRTAAWRVLNSGWSGISAGGEFRHLCQSRPRIFMVATAREGFCARRVLSIGEGNLDEPKGVLPGQKWGCGTMLAASAGTCNSRGVRVIYNNRWRRLTYSEELQRQGFPGDWGNIDAKHRGKGKIKREAYVAIGNSMAVPVVRQIGVRIAEQLNGG